MTRTDGTVSARGIQTDTDLDAARRVLELEIAGLRALSDHLDGTFEAVTALLAATAGRVVVTGMGKSGHVANKIAATLASTGTPALFVHPAEAGHGDLGMIARDDAVLALSNSGETVELGAITAYTRRFAIPLVAIVGKSPSTLADSADHALVLPGVPEACPMGLAPTTSSTMMLALGDALAVALLERKGFSSDDFHVLHPGGRLGQRLIRVDDIMHRGDAVPLIGPGTPMADALVAITSKSFGCVGVLDETRGLIGIITDGDLRRHMGNDLLKRTAAEVMTSAPKTIDSHALAAEALGRMNAGNITSLFVVDGRSVVGIIHVHDCLRAGVA
jgi:arabinose-5-phosphate isomerase